MPFDAGPYLGRPFDVDRWNCWILVATVLNDVFDLDVPTGKATWPAPGDREAIEHTFAEEQTAYRLVDCRDGFLTRSVDYRPGDIVQLRVYREVCHVGVIHARRRMLHVMERTETYLADLDSPEWRPRVQSVYRHPGMA